MKNATLDINQAIKWYPDVIKYQWKVTQQFFAGELLLGSYTMDMSIFSYRKRKNKPKII